jgi:cytochrome c peroxidase
MVAAFACLVLMLVLNACKKDDKDSGNDVVTLQIPKGFPYPTIPSDNQPTKNRIELGRKLFSDPILSRDSTIACSNCHHADKKMTDGLVRSTGIEGRQTLRNAMTILNVAYQPSMFWDGGVPTLEQQVIAPIENHQEMDFNVNLVVERLKNHPEYPALFLKAYNQQPSPFTLTRAIACFERTFYTGKSKFDEYQYDNNTTALSPSEKRGMDIFFGEQGECFHCHNGYNFTDYNFRNNGLYSFFADSGRARITGKTEDVGKFKVPSLRNIALTAPYMHDGSKATLEDVLEHYNSGGLPHPNKSFLIKPLNLTQQEKDDLINFLKALSDQ